MSTFSLIISSCCSYGNENHPMSTIILFFTIFTLCSYQKLNQICHTIKKRDRLFTTNLTIYYLNLLFFSYVFGLMFSFTVSLSVCMYMCLCKFNQIRLKSKMFYRNFYLFVNSYTHLCFPQTYKM